MMYKIRLAITKFGDTILAMKKFVWVLVGALTIIFTPVNFVRATPNQRGLLIVELQTGSTASASEEFVELYNQSEDTLDMSTYKLEYFPASATTFSSPSRTIALSGTLYPGGRYLVASSGYLASVSNTSFSATLAKTGGHLRVVSGENQQTVIHDLVGWGSAGMPEGTSAPAPGSGESLQRKILADGSYQDTDDNQVDFSVSITPSPEANNPQPTPTEQPEPIATDPAPEPTDPVADPAPEDTQPIDITPETQPEQVANNPILLPVQITELLPNPSAPKTDADDEFIELYNPNDISVELENYRLETGNTYSYHYTFGTLTISPHAYISISSKETGLVLANGGGKARLLSQDGSIMSETQVYDQADEDMSWAFVGGAWQWTALPTPGAENVVVSPESKAPAKTAPALLKKTPIPKVPAAKKPTVKVASAKTTKPKASSAKTKITNSENVASASPSKTPFHAAILAVIGLLALGYAGYEYRSDIANYFHKLRGFRKNRRNIGQPS